MILLIGLHLLAILAWIYAAWRLYPLVLILALGLLNATFFGIILDVAYAVHPDQARYADASPWPLTISMAVAWSVMGWALRAKLAARRASREAADGS